MLETISNNVRALGEVLGQTIAEDKGDNWVDKIEEVRILGKRIVRTENKLFKRFEFGSRYCIRKRLCDGAKH